MHTTVTRVVPARLLTTIALAAGGAAGYVLAWWLHGTITVSNGDIATANELGIVSRTILAGYPKSRDTLNYLLALLLPVLGALLAWLPLRRGRKTPGEAVHGGFSDHGLSHLWLWPAVLAAVLWSWHSGALQSPGWNEYVRAWPYLGEEGATLAWVQSLSTGGVFGRDFFSLYGPMFVYPLLWLMDLAQDSSAMMERYYKFGLQMAAFALLAVLLLRTMRTRILALALFAGIVLVYPPLASHSANTSILRAALALFSLGATALWLDEGKRRWLWIAGLTLGQSFLFSQEAAICAFAAASAMLWFHAWGQHESWPRLLRAPLALWGITLLSMAPMLGYLISHSAGPALLDSLIGYPRLVLLGFGAQPFPSLREWLPAAPRAHALHYTVIAIYSVALIRVARAWLDGERSTQLLWTIGLTIFGILLFRQALGRSEPGQTIKVMLPAILLTGAWIDAAWTGWRQGGTSTPALATITVPCLIALLVGIGADPLVRNNIQLSQWMGLQTGDKFGAPRRENLPAGATIHPRVGFLLDTQTLNTVYEIEGFLNRFTRKGEPVYFFPNEAAYYHLFERPNPTRYAISYFAASFERQRELIADLERNRPRFVVYSKWTWRVDDIPENVQVPLVVNYLMGNYHPVASMDNVEILARN